MSAFSASTLLAVGLLNDVYFWLAVVGTGLFVLRMILLMFGGDAHDGGGDMSGHDAVDVSAHPAGDSEGHADPGDSFMLFSIQTFLAFLMGMGWMGLAAERSFNLSKGYAFAASLGFGFLMMLLMAYLLNRMKRLTHEVSYDPKQATGNIGRTYLPVPPKGTGEGQIEITVSGRKMIFRAQNSGTEAIPAFHDVKVVSVEGETMTVEPCGK